MWFVLTPACFCTAQLQEMDMETRSAPPSYRNQLNSKLNDFRSELAKLRRDLVRAEGKGERPVHPLTPPLSLSICANQDNLRGGGGGRDELFAGGRGGQSYQSGAADQRSRLLQGTDRLQATSDRLANAQRIGEESGLSVCGGEGARNLGPLLTCFCQLWTMRRGHWRWYSWRA